MQLPLFETHLISLAPKERIAFMELYIKFLLEHGPVLFQHTNKMSKIVGGPVSVIPAENKVLKWYTQRPDQWILLYETEVTGFVPLFEILTVVEEKQLKIYKELVERDLHELNITFIDVNNRINILQKRIKELSAL